MVRLLSALPVWGAVVVSLALVGCAESPEVNPSPEGAEHLSPSQSRPDVRGTHGAVSAGHPLAAAAGYDVLKRGGNAVDAAVTMAGVLAVVRPHMNGVGGDAFALIYDRGEERVFALNGSGRAGALADPEFFRERGAEGTIPSTGPLSVSVPGAVAAWADALERFGTITLAEALEPAIQYAADGFPVSKRLGSDIAGGGRGLNGPGSDLYLPGGEPPQPGSLLRNPALARTLQLIAADGKDGFYRGDPARTISGYLEREGGYLREADFASHSSTWVEPLSVEYEGHTVLVLPPNTQGIAQLQLLEMAKGHGLAGMNPTGADYLHTLIELKKLAFADRNRWVADPAFVDIPVDGLLDEVYLADRAGMVDMGLAATDVTSGLDAGPDAGPDAGLQASPDALDDSGDTVYLTAVDRWGNGVSWIQSLFNTFGSGILEPESGVVLQNRGALFLWMNPIQTSSLPGSGPTTPSHH